MRQQTKPFRRFAMTGLAGLMLVSGFGCGDSHKATSSGGAGASGKGTITLLNVSYDPTRELYKDYDQVFVKYWQGKAGQTVTINQSHGGSGKQAHAVIDGQEADVVTLGIASDIDAIQQAGDIKPGWEQRLPDDAVPYTSTIVFLVRKGNPKGIKDWADLIKPGVAVITPNPKTSSGGRWNYLAAWGQALQKPGGTQDTARAYVAALYKNVPVLDSGARGSTDTFVQRGQGDVLLGWENDAELEADKLAKGQYEVVYPSVSIQAEPPIAVVDKYADKHGTTAVATEYLKYLYSPEGQDVAARNFYRPHSTDVAAKYAAQFPKIPLFTAEKVFGTWDQIQKTHFADGGTFDQIYHH
jgi:sulfate/thiosulfate-binding protein